MQPVSPFKQQDQSPFESFRDVQPQNQINAHNENEANTMIQEKTN